MFESVYLPFLCIVLSRVIHPRAYLFVKTLKIKKMMLALDYYKKKSASEQKKKVEYFFGE